MTPISRNSLSFMSPAPHSSSSSSPSSSTSSSSSSTSSSTASAPDSASPTNRSALDLLPTVLQDQTTGFLQLSHQEKLARTNQSFLSNFKKDLAQKVRPELTGDKVALAQDPTNWRDKDVATELRGRHYLNSLGIVGSVMMHRIKSGELTIQEALARITANKDAFDLTLEISHLDPIQQDKLADPFIRNCIYNELMTIDEALERNVDQYIGVDFKDVQNYMNLGLISSEQARDMNLEQLTNILSAPIQKYLERGLLSMDEVLDDTSNLRFRLTDLDMQKYVDQGLLTPREVGALSNHQTYILRFDGMSKYLESGLLSMDQALKLATHQARNLGNELVQQHIDAGLLDIDQALHLSMTDIASLKPSLKSNLKPSLKPPVSEISFAESTS